MNRTEEISESNLESIPPTIEQTEPMDFSKITNTFSDVSESNSFNLTNVLIFILIVLVLFSFLGLNILTVLGSSLQNFSNIINPFIKQFLVAIGYSSGEIINKSADVTSDAAKIGIDIAEGTIHNVGDLLKKGASELEGSQKPPLDQKINSKESTTESKPESKPEAKPDTSDNPIQKPITAEKMSWCLVGEYENKRGCVSVTDSDKCLSGQIFPSQQMCLNPTFTP